MYTALLLDFVETLFTAQTIEELLSKASEFITASFKLSNCFICINENKKRFYSNPQLEKEYSKVEKEILGSLKSLKTHLLIKSVREDILTKNLGAENIPDSVLAIPLIRERVFLGAIFIYSEFKIKEAPEIIDEMQKRFLNAYEHINKYDLLKRISVTDQLTGLFNRSYMLEYLHQTLKRCHIDKKPSSLIILDLDNFKQYNDAKGHLEGDKLLKKAAECIRKKFRVHDVACRYGGEEFVIILPDAENKMAFNRAEDIRKSVEDLCNITASIGVMTCLNSSLSPEEMLKNADDALYRAKKTGKNKVIQYISIDKSLGVIDTSKA